MASFQKATKPQPPAKLYLLGNNPKIQQANGIKKPLGCAGCPVSSISSGFLRDYVTSETQVLVISDYPKLDDIIFESPLSGTGGWWWKKFFFERLGVPTKVWGFSHLLRCHPKGQGAKRHYYPTGQVRTKGEKLCRQYDWPTFKPDCFVVTFGFHDILATKQLITLMESSFLKALELAQRGYKPALLLGNEVMEYHAPWLAKRGGVKVWQGHWWEGE